MSFWFTCLLWKFWWSFVERLASLVGLHPPPIPVGPSLVRFGKGSGSGCPGFSPSFNPSCLHGYGYCFDYGYGYAFFFFSLALFFFSLTLCPIPCAFLVKFVF